MLFCSNFHRLEALEACLEACPDVFCSNVHGLPTLEFETLFHPINFLFCCNFPYPWGLEACLEAVPLRQLRPKILARQHSHPLLQVQPCWDFNLCQYILRPRRGLGQASPSLEAPRLQALATFHQHNRKGKIVMIKTSRYMRLVMGSFLAPETDMIFGDGVGASLVGR